MRFYDQYPAVAQLYQEVTAGLRGEPKSIPPNISMTSAALFCSAKSAVCRNIM